MTDASAPQTAGTQPRAAGPVATAGGAAAVIPPPGERRSLLGGRALPLLFLLPAVVMLGALVIYPTISTLIRSLFSNDGHSFVGLGNYVDMFSRGETLTAIKNNAIWVVVAPSVVTILGLIFAVLSERIRWATAFKFVVFMPMAIGFLASGVIFRLVYQVDPNQGVANAIAVGIHDTFSKSSEYAGALARPNSGLTKAGGALVLQHPAQAGQQVLLPLVGLAPASIPAAAQTAKEPGSASGNQISGTVWLDFTRGGGGKPGVVDSSEKGLPGMRVQALSAGKVVSSATADSHGEFTLGGLKDGQSYQVRLEAANFAAPYRGIDWLGPSLATPAIIAAYIWMWAGFAMVLIGAGLAAIPRDALEAARVDGATEWNVFRRVTVPLLSPILLVVLVTLVINVLKIFDLVLIIAPGNVQANANVLALEMWRVSFGGQPLRGLGSAIAIFLLLLVIPAMLFNLRRFRQEQR
ncbi:MAG: ABC transporter permease subunit [Actinomycetota bacterium]|nr:ABC transporter permease subunit [Actinomycetota bacterium]